MTDVITVEVPTDAAVVETPTASLGDILGAALLTSRPAVIEEPVAETLIVPDAAGGTVEVPIVAGESIAPAYAPPPSSFPANTPTMEQMIARGYHIVTPPRDDIRVNNFNYECYYTLDNLYDHVRQAFHDEDRRDEDWADANPKAESASYSSVKNAPVRFVRRNEEAFTVGGPLYVPCTDWDDIIKGSKYIAKMCHLSDWFESETRAPSRSRTATRAPSVDRLNAALFNEPRPITDSSNWVPENLMLSLDVENKKLVSVGMDFTVVVNDEEVVDNKKNNLSTLSSRSRSVAKPAKGKKNLTLVIDTHGLMVWGADLKHGFEHTVRNHKNRIDNLISEVFDLGKLHKPSMVILNNIQVICNNATLERALAGANLQLSPGGSATYLAKSDLIISTETVASVAAFNKMSVFEMSQEEYARQYIAKFTKAFGKKRDKLDKAITEASKKIMSASQRKGEIVMMLDLLQSKGMEAMRAKFDGINTIEGVESSSFTGKGIEVITREFYNEDASYGNRFLGKFRFVINLLSNGVTVQNLMQADKNGYTCTVHYGVDQGFCLGSYPSVLGAAMAAADYDTLVRVLLEFVRSPHLHDGHAQIVYRRMPVDAPTVPVEGKEYTLFGSGDYNFDSDF